MWFVVEFRSDALNCPEHILGGKPVPLLLLSFITIKNIFHKKQLF